MKNKKVVEPSYQPGEDRWESSHPGCSSEEYARVLDAFEDKLERLYPEEDRRELIKEELKEERLLTLHANQLGG